MMLEFYVTGGLMMHPVLLSAAVAVVVLVKYWRAADARRIALAAIASIIPFLLGTLGACLGILTDLEWRSLSLPNDPVDSLLERFHAVALSFHALFFGVLTSGGALVLLVVSIATGRARP